jgi:hypothetical protein
LGLDVGEPGGVGAVDGLDATEADGALVVGVAAWKLVGSSFDSDGIGVTV